MDKTALADILTATTDEGEREGGDREKELENEAEDDEVADDGGDDDDDDDEDNMVELEEILRACNKAQSKVKTGDDKKDATGKFCMTIT